MEDNTNINIEIIKVFGKTETKDFNAMKKQKNPGKLLVEEETIK